MQKKVRTKLICYPSKSLIELPSFFREGLPLVDESRELMNIGLIPTSYMRFTLGARGGRKNEPERLAYNANYKMISEIELQNYQQITKYLVGNN
jgi:hypothetical protein